MPAKKPPSGSSAEPAPTAVTRSRLPVVGIGASAGGLEAATTFFRQLSPQLGMAYILGCVLYTAPMLLVKSPANFPSVSASSGYSAVIACNFLATASATATSENPFVR